MPVSPVRLNHAVLYVSDIDRSVAFYTTVFGMEVVEWKRPGNAAFLRLPRSGNHHDLGLFGLGSSSRRPDNLTVGLYHLAWQVATIDDLAEIRESLLGRGVLTGESNHGATKSLYGADPDGNEFEIMWMVPREDWGVYESRAVVEPLFLEGEIMRYSGQVTAGDHG